MIIKGVEFLRALLPYESVISLLYNYRESKVASLVPGFDSVGTEFDGQVVDMRFDYRQLT